MEYTGQRGTLGIDWDGVIHESPEWRPVMGKCNFDIIREAHKRGYAVAIITAGEIPDQVRVLREAGFKATPDPTCIHGWWRGGENGTNILVTHRKISCAAYIDDRAIQWEYGRDTHDVFNLLAARDILRKHRESVTITRLED